MKIKKIINIKINKSEKNFVLTITVSRFDNYRFFLLGIFFLGLIFDLFIYPPIWDILVIILILFWIFNVIKFRIKPTETLILGVFSYLVAFVIQFWGNEMVVEKGASWFFVFLSIALIQTLIKEFSKNEKKA